MTNEEWFCNLSTEEKARFIAVEKEFHKPEIMQLMLLSTSKTLVEWLNMEHVD